VTPPAVAAPPGRWVLPIGSITAVALCLGLVVGCGGSGPSPAPTASQAGGPAASSASIPSATATARGTVTPAPSLDRTASFRAAITALAAARDDVHPDGWHGMARAEWVAAADAAAAKIDHLTDDQALVELVRLAAMPSWNGRDGHSGIFPFIPGSGTHEYPVRWWRFSDGLVITATGPGVDPALVGQRVVAVAGHPIDDVLALVEPLAPRDNPSNLLAYGPLYLRVSELLAGLGIIDRAGPTPFTLVGREGVRHDVTLSPILADQDVAWNSGLPHRLPPTDAPWLARQDEVIWWTFLEDSGTLFVQDNEIAAVPFSVADPIVQRASRDDVRRVVVDVRHNGGGDNTTLVGLEGALRKPAIDRPGRLVILMSRVTFSAAANFVTDMERSSSAIFAGEPMGGSPNLYGDAEPIALPWGGQTLYMATRYHERSTPDDARITIEPDIAVTLSAADYFAGRDPVLEAVIGQGPPSG
jgi:hypothetical protein